MKLESNEPTLETIEDYDGKESKKKRKTVWFIIISGVVIALIYGILIANSEVSDEIADSNKTGIFKTGIFH